MSEQTQTNLLKYTPTERILSDGTKCAFAFHEFESKEGELIHTTKATFDYKEGAEQVEFAEIWCRKDHPDILFYIIERHGSHSHEDISTERHKKYIEAFRLVSDVKPASKVPFMARLTPEKFIVRYFRMKNDHGPAHQTIKDKLELFNIEVGNKSCEGFVKSGFRLFRADITGNEVRILFTQNPVHIRNMEKIARESEDEEMIMGVKLTSKPGHKLTLPEF